MSIVEVPPNKDWVTVSASVSSIEKCFQTKLATWENSRSGLVSDITLFFVTVINH